MLSNIVYAQARDKKYLRKMGAAKRSADKHENKIARCEANKNTGFEFCHIVPQRFKMFISAKD